ncbi:MAG: T9SS type A sorting domain-containing protein, partial [Melioribacteraceae bacterium]|nr:T9SS type A sorting domain-containing protein [Melioribacteraceae bacterium]
GATINGEKKVGGSTYDSGLRPGRIIGEGESSVREDETLEHVRIYRVRRDLNDGFSSEIADGEGSAEEIRAQYEKDWNEWPAQYGAPYEDVDNDGIYNPSFDIPGIPSADQTIWFVANDLDTAKCRRLYGSDPMGVEMQVTVWGYNSGAEIGNTLFRKYKLINKSGNAFDSMYVSVWADADLGAASDDFAGCDSALSLMFTYNGKPHDATYGDYIPAVGFGLFQGPIIPSQGDTALVDGKYKLNYKNLPISTHYFFIGGDAVYNDPDLGSYINGTLPYHDLFRGLSTSNGDPFIDPTTGKATKFTLAGNPVTGVGWIDGILHQPGDRRQGMVAGPFNMAAGDTQEVVVAFMASFGDNYIDAITKLKDTDYYMQGIYNNNFSDIERAPVPPKVSASVVDKDPEAILTWQKSSEIEDFESDGYKFQGYNIFQISEGTRLLIKTFDIIDGVKTISQLEYDTDLETEVMKEVQFGTDSGIEYEFIIEKDYINDSKLLKGKEYHFVVVAYTYTSDESKKVKTSSSSPELIDFRYIYNSYGFNFGESFDVKHIEGNGDVDLDIKVYDSDLITGDEYEIFFNQQHYYMGIDGEWHETNFPDSIGKSLAKDISPAYLSGISYVASATTRDLKFMIQDLEASPDYSYCDGIELTFPAGVTILSADPSAYTDPVINGQVVTWGGEDTTENGPFHGGELLTVTVDVVSLPLTVDYIMWDDGWGWLNMPNYGGTGEYKHAVGSVTITEETNYFRSENQWNLLNTTTNELVLEKDRVYDGIDIYANFWDVPFKVDEVIVDGLKINLNVSFDAPINFLSVELNEGSPSNLTSYFSTTTIDIQNYTMFAVANSYAMDNFGVGTYDIEELQQDYELRFTGIYDEGTTIYGAKVYKVLEGGSMATCFRMSSAANLANNPLNPNYGTAEPFLVRIPFEVWNVDDPDNPYQVNLTYRDRARDGSEDTFYAWNPTNRMYGIIVNSPYDDKQVIQVDGGPDEFNDPATWVLVFYGTNYTEGAGDVVKVNYANPIQVGKDRLSFATLVDGKNTLEGYSISQNYPNPFNPTTKIDFTLLNDGFVNLTVYDILGREVTRLIDNNVRAGEYTITFNANNLASGIYFYRISTTDFIEVKKMLLLK